MKTGDFQTKKTKSFRFKLGSIKCKKHLESNFALIEIRGVPEREDIVLFYVNEEEKTVADLSLYSEINEENENQFLVVPSFHILPSPPEAGKYVVRKKSIISSLKIIFILALLRFRG